MPRPRQLLDPPRPLPPPTPPASAALLRPRPPKRPLRLPANPVVPGPFPDPSSGLLALLLSAAASAPVDGRPLDSDADISPDLPPDFPPDFLCPRLYVPPTRSSQPSSSQEPPFWYWAPCDDPSSSSAYRLVLASETTDRAATSRRRRVPRTEIADKYEQSEEDGRWRKADSWELYGSSSCAIAQCVDTSTSTPTELPVEDESVSTSTAATSSTMPALPNGWGNTSTEDGLTGVILGLSLSLAFALIFLMVGVVLWRRKRRKTRERDAEKTPSPDDGDAAEPSEEIKRAMTHQRRWARASAKWMANVRHSARRRRKHSSTSVVKGSDTNLLINNKQSTRASSSSISISRTRTSDTHDDTSSSWRHISRSRSRIESLSRSPSPSSASHHPDPSALSPNPPAYIPGPSCPRNPSLARASRGSFGSSDTSLPTKLPLPCHADVSPPPHSPPLPYASVHSAHIATDDKTVLARMAEMASAPPPADGSWLPAPSAGSSGMRPSVPVLEGDEFEPLPPDLQSEVDAFVHHAGRSSSGTTHVILGASSTYSPRATDNVDGDVPTYAEDAIRHRPFALPPPPEKVPLAGPTFYEYPGEFEDDVANVEPSLGPSSPPFEEEPSAPPLEFAASAVAHMVGPSAPPLEYAEGPCPSSDALSPSAPGLDPGDGLGSEHGASVSDGRPGVVPSAPPPPSPDDRPHVAGDGPSTGDGRRRLDRVSPPRYLP